MRSKLGRHRFLSLALGAFAVRDGKNVDDGGQGQL